MPPKRVGSLAFRLSLLVAAVALPLVGLAAWAVWQSQNNIQVRAEAALQNRVRTIALAVDREFDRAWALLDALAASAAVARGDLAIIEDEMRAVSAVSEGAAVTLVATDGMIMFSTLWQPAERRAGVRAPDVARQVMAEGRSQVTDLFIVPASGRAAVAVGVPIPARNAAPDGTPRLGSFGLSLPRERLSAILHTQLGADTPGWVAAIIDRSGVALARTGREEGIVGRRARLGTLERLVGDGGIIRGLRTLDGVRAVTAFARGPRSGYAFILSMPLAEFSAPLRRDLSRTLGGGMLVLALGLGIAALIARRTVKAFRTAAGAAEGQGEGQGEGRGEGQGPVQTGLREANDLARALAEAAEERQRTAAALRESEERFRLVAESAPVMLWMANEAGRCVFQNRALRDFWGVPPEEFAEFDWPATLHPEDRPRLLKQFVHSLRTRSGFSLEARYRHRAGRFRTMHTVAQPRFEPNGAFLGMIGANADVTDDRQAEAALRKSEERLRLAQEAGGIGAWEFDITTQQRYWSDSTYRLWGVAPGTPVTLELLASLVHPDDVARTHEAVAKAATITGQLPDLEMRITRRSDGALRWLLSSAEAVADDHGRQVRQVGIMRDITEQKDYEERLRLLAAELDHRAKNALAVVQAALRLTPKEDPHAYARAVEGRIGALARAHTLLARSRWEGAMLRALVEAELAAFLPHAGPANGAAAVPRIVLDGPPVVLVPAATQALSMAIHELATNATKHGALSRPDGHLRVGWRVDDAAAALHLTWTEEGGPPIAGPPSRRGFGSRLIQGTVGGQLGGEVTRRWEAQGLVCEIAVPLARALSLHPAT